MDEIDRIRLFLFVAERFDGETKLKFWASVSDATLIEATKCLYTNVSIAAIDILEERNGAEVELALSNAKEDTDSDVRYAAACALQERQMNEWNNEILIKVIKDHHNSKWTLTSAAINTLKKRQMSKSDVKALIEVVNSSDIYVRQAATNIFFATSQGRIALRKELVLAE